MKSNFLRRRWLDFRNGHSIYLGFILTFVNFILITYNFAIKQIPFFHGVFDNLLVFVLLFIGFYVPVAIIIGYWHRRNQYSVENEAMIQENWIWAWILQFQIRQIQGKTTPEETDKVIAYLNAILKKHKKDTLLGVDLNFDPKPEESVKDNS